MKKLVLVLLTLSVSFWSLDLKIGIHDDYPLCYLEDGKAKGFYVDILNYIAKKENWKIEYVYGKWEDLIKKLKKDEINAIVAIAYTPKRAEDYIFNNESFLENWGVVVSKGKLTSIFELSGKDLVLVKDDVYAKAFLEIAGKFKVRLGKITWVDTYEEALKALGKKAYAAVVSRIAAVVYKKRYGYKTSPIIFSPVELRMAFSRLYPFAESVAARVDHYLLDMKSDENSIYWKLLEKYLLLEGKELPIAKYMGIFIEILSILLTVMIYLFVLFRKKTIQLKNANMELLSANGKIRKMNLKIDSLMKELKESFKRFQEVVELASNISTFTMEEKEFMERILQLALKLVPKAKYGSVSLLEGNKWRFVAAVGHDMEILKSLDLKREYAMADLKNPLIVNRILEKDRDIMPPDILEKLKKASKTVKSTIIAPIKIGETLIGFFTVDIPEGSDEEFTEEDAEIVDRFSKIVSGFYAVRRFQELEGKLHKEIVLTLVKALEYYDIYTRGHSERVAMFSTRLAEKHGLPRDRIKKIYWAALVHDIGKIYIPQSILNKPGKLDDDEYARIKEHPVKGYEMLKESKELEDIAWIVLHHHERCDGKGYPFGKRCDEIPLESRVIAVADAYDAMTSARAYREPLSFEKAIIELLNGAGTQFDPEIVRAFVEMIREMREEEAS